MENWDKKFETYRKHETFPRLPEGHEQRFTKRITASKSTGPSWRWIAAAGFVLMIGLGKMTQPVPNEKALALEQHFNGKINQKMQVIETRFGQEHTNTIANIKKQLVVLDQEYQNLSERFESNYQHPRLLKAMTQNLAHRLKLINELENKLSELSKKRKTNASI